MIDWHRHMALAESVMVTPVLAIGSTVSTMWCYCVTLAMMEDDTHMMVVLVVARLVLVGTCTWSEGPAEVEAGGDSDHDDTSICSGQCSLSLL